MLLPSSAIATEWLYPQSHQLGDQESATRQEEGIPISTSISNCWQGWEIPHFVCRVSWGTSTAPARAEIPVSVSAITCRALKAELGRGQTHFSRQTCSRLKAKFRFSFLTQNISARDLTSVCS